MTYRTYLFQYFHEGTWWSLEIRARDEADAKARLAKLPHAQYSGVLVAKIPAGPIGIFNAWLRGRRTAAALEEK